MSDTTEYLIESLRARAGAGLAKYGTSLDRTDLTIEDWLQHGIEEALDLAGYLQSAKREIGTLRGDMSSLRADNERLRAVLIPLAALAGEALIGAVPVLSPPTALPSAIMVTPTEALEVPVQEETAPSPVAAVNIPETGEVKSPETDAVPPALSVPVPASVPLPAPPSGNVLRCAGPTSEPWAVHCPKKALVSAVGRRCFSCSAKERTSRTPMPKRQAPVPVGTAPEIVPTFDVNEAGRDDAVDEGKRFYSKEGRFTLVRLVLENSYSWRVVGALQIPADGEAVETWHRNGLGQWESANITPGGVGIGQGVSRGAIHGSIVG